MRKLQRHPQAEMFDHVKAWENSNQSQKAYCKAQGLACSTFRYWIEKYHKVLAKDNTLKDNQGFIPLKVQPGSQASSQARNNLLHFLMPN